MDTRDPELAERLSTLQLDGSIEPFAQLADWLRARASPWGELIAVQLAGQRDEALERAVSAGQPPLQGATWHRGFLRATAIGPLAPPGTEPKDIDAKAGEALDRFLRWGPASKLESLELSPPSGRDDRTEAVVRSTAAFPATLRELRVTRLTMPDLFVRMLNGTRHMLPQLETLDLSNGYLDGRRTKYFFEFIPNLRHLKELDLRGNFLEPAEAAQLKAAVPGALVGDQHVGVKLDTSEYRETEHEKFLRIHGKLSAEDYD